MIPPTDINYQLLADMRGLYQEVDATTTAHSSVCVNRGLCCKFGEFGHKLYVTDVELSYFLAGQGGTARPVEDVAACPYQVAGQCTAREHRPLGCRIFFCDPAAQGWQGPEYERFLEKLKHLGRRHGVAYRYREWLSALAEHAESNEFISPAPITPVDHIPLPVIK